MAQSGSGTATFLFTGLEGSTRLLRRLDDAYADLLHTQQRVVRAAFEAYGARSRTIRARPGRRTVR